MPDADDDDKIGPDNCRNDDRMLPEPDDGAAANEPVSFESSSRSSPPDGAGAPPDRPPLELPLEPPDKPLRPPADVPLSEPNLVVMAAILGWITACSSDCSEVIGTGALMPYASFLAMFDLSNWLMKLVLASRIPSIFYGFANGFGARGGWTVSPADRVWFGGAGVVWMVHARRDQ